MRLKDRAAIVTGAAQGIGKAVGTAFVEEGARLVIGDINGDLAQKTAAELAKGGRGVRSIRIDVAEATAGNNPSTFACESSAVRRMAQPKPGWNCSPG